MRNFVEFVGFALMIAGCMMLALWLALIVAGVALVVVANS